MAGSSYPALETRSIGLLGAGCSGRCSVGTEIYSVITIDKYFNERIIVVCTTVMACLVVTFCADSFVLLVA